jgi:hypothetical protein
MFKSFLLILLLALLGLSCTTKLHYPNKLVNPDNDKKAINLIWYGYLKQTRSPPRVEWKYGQCLRYENAILYDNSCYFGLFFKDTWIIWVADRGHYSSSSFGHEILHAYLYLEGKDDPQHERPEWKELLPVMNQMLSKAGL